MFENVGEKIPSVSKILVWIGIIGGILMFFSGFLKAIESSEYSFYYRQAKETIAFTTMIGGVLLAIGSYLTSLFLFAFGKIVVDIERISEELVVNQNVSFKTDKDNLPEI